MRIMQAPDDVWRALTTMALRLLNDLDAELAPVLPSEIADRTLSLFGDVRQIEGYRVRLEAFVADMVEE